MTLKRFGVLAVCAWVMFGSWASSEIRASEIPGSTLTGAPQEGHPDRLFIPLQDVWLSVYLPPTYATEPQTRFPVMYWCGGTGSKVIPVDFSDPKASARQRKYDIFSPLDSQIRAGTIPPLIVVHADGNHSSWEETVRFIDGRFRTLATRQGRILAGFSGGCENVLRGIFIHSNLFAGALGLAHPVFYGIYQNNGVVTRQVLESNLKSVRANQPGIALFVGSLEKSKVAAMAHCRQQLAERYNFASSVTIVPGMGHDKSGFSRSTARRSSARQQPS